MLSLFLFLEWGVGMRIFACEEILMASLTYRVLRVLKVTSALAISKKYDLLCANTIPPVFFIC